MVYSKKKSSNKSTIYYSAKNTLTKKTNTKKTSKRNSLNSFEIVDVCKGNGDSFNTKRSKYDFHKKIGEGTYGKVYTASNTNKNNSMRGKYVVKVQHISSNYDEDIKE
jgi:hypothetical protein